LQLSVAEAFRLACQQTTIARFAFNAFFFTDLPPCVAVNETIANSQWNSKHLTVNFVSIAALFWLGA
jgi:hypothetical protein